MRSNSFGCMPPKAGAEGELAFLVVLLKIKEMQNTQRASPPPTSPCPLIAPPRLFYSCSFLKSLINFLFLRERHPIPLHSFQPSTHNWCLHRPAGLLCMHPPSRHYSNCHSCAYRITSILRCIISLPTDYALLESEKRKHRNLYYFQWLPEYSVFSKLRTSLLVNVI